MPPRTQRRASPAREGPDLKRVRILEAARQVCAQRGYEAATMEAVAAEARVSKGTLYNYFASKEHLFLSTVLLAYDQAEARMEARVGLSNEPGVRLDGLIEAMVEGFPAIASGMLVNLQAWAVVSRDATARERMFEDLRGRYARLGQDLCETLRAGQKAGVFRKDLDAHAVADGVSAIHDGFVYRSVFDPANADAAALARALRELIRDRVFPAASGADSR